MILLILLLLCGSYVWIQNVYIPMLAEEIVQTSIKEYTTQYMNIFYEEVAKELAKQ